MTTDVSKSKDLSSLSAGERFREIRDEIRKRICVLIYPPNAPLSEAKLAAEFGVSRTPIRAVLGQLAAEGLIETQQGVVTRVTEIEGDVAIEDYELRAHLAELVGTMGIKQADQSDVDALRRIIDELEFLRKSPSIQKYGVINLAYHDLFLNRIRSASLRNITSVLYVRTSRNWLSRSPTTDWNEEIDYFQRWICLMIEMVGSNDSRGVGLVQRTLILESLKRMRTHRDGGAYLVGEELGEELSNGLDGRNLNTVRP